MTKILLQLFFIVSITFASPLQKAIDNADAYATLKLPAGLYLGNVTINKPLTIIGKDKSVVIDGDGSGSVVTISSSHVILQNITITNSGNKMDKIDSAIAMKNVKQCEINSCRILNSLYGIDMLMVNDSVIANNYITSKKNDIDLRGDALKIWYSNNNVIKNNTIENARDVTLSYSNNNMIDNNTFLNNRFAIHMSLSNQNILKNNSFKYNSVGIMVMGSKKSELIHNDIQSCKGAAGIGVVLKGVSNLLFEKNSVKFNAQGIYLDTKHNEEGMQRRIINNVIAYNKEAFHFHGAIKNNTMVNNAIYANIDDVVKSAKSDVTYLNVVERNYWDKYAGFDKDGDNTGDTPHKIYQYADQLWHYNHKVKFFYASPVMTLLNFLANLAPFVEPVLIIEDKKPLMRATDSLY